METWLGIDFGTCSTRAAYLAGGDIRSVKEPSSHGFTFPSAAFLAKDGQLLVGQIAENQSLSDPTRFRKEFKRDLGSGVPYTLGDVRKTPEELITAMLDRVRVEAERALDRPFDGVVLTVPASYNKYKRELMSGCARLAGFYNVTLLEEPVAAARIHAREAQQSRLAEGEILLVYDLGGGTFDAALLQKRGDDYIPLCLPRGLEHCGGIDLDWAIYADMLVKMPQLRERLATQSNEPSYWRLHRETQNAARRVKHDLSDATSSQYFSPATGEAYELTRDEFVRATLDPLMQQTFGVCRQISADAGVEFGAVKGVLLVGGSCRIPAVEDAVASELKLPTYRVSDSELAVCHGAAVAKSEAAHEPPATSISEPNIDTTVLVPVAVEPVPVSPIENESQVAKADSEPAPPVGGSPLPKLKYEGPIRTTLFVILFFLSGVRFSWFEDYDGYHSFHHYSLFDSSSSFVVLIGLVGTLFAWRSIQKSRKPQAWETILTMGVSASGIMSTAYTSVQIPSPEATYKLFYLTECVLWAISAGLSMRYYRPPDIGALRARAIRIGLFVLILACSTFSVDMWRFLDGVAEVCALIGIFATLSTFDDSSNGRAAAGWSVCVASSIGLLSYLSIMVRDRQDHIVPITCVLFLISIILAVIEMRRHRRVQVVD